MWHWCNLAAKESGLKCKFMNNDDFTVLVSGGGRWLARACVLCGHLIQNDWASRAKNLHPSHVEFFVKYQIIQVTQPSYSPDLVPCDFWLFPKLKSPLKAKRFQTIHGIWKIWWASWWRFQPRILQSVLNSGRDTENCVTSQGAYFEGDWGIIVSHAVFLVSSSINVSMFHVTCCTLSGQSSLCM